MTNICAAIGVAQIERLSTILSRKLELGALSRRLCAERSSNSVAFQYIPTHVISSEWLASLPFPEGTDRNAVTARIEWAHIGADIGQSFPTRDLPDNAEAVLATLRSRPSFLMVGTIEPRKGHSQTTEAFNLLRRGNVDINLVIVGAEGWKPLPDDQRRTIPPYRQFTL